MTEICERFRGLFYSGFSEMCLERWRKISDICDVIVRPPPALLLTSVFRKRNRKY